MTYRSIRAGLLVASSVGLLLSACAIRSVRLDGVSPVAAWRIENLTIQQDLERAKWRYWLRISDRTGSGLHLTKVVASFSGHEFQHWTPITSQIDLRVPPGGEVTFPCGRTIRPASGGRMLNWHLTERRTYTGQDGKGQSITMTVELPFGDFDAPAASPLLDFARMTTFNGGSGIMQCEAVARDMTVFDPNKQDAPYLVIGVDNVQRAISLKTRWISPIGEEVRVVEGTIRADQVQRGTLFVHYTHSIPGSLVVAQPGTWKVELYLDDKLHGTYQFAVPPRPSSIQKL